MSPTPGGASAPAFTVTSPSTTAKLDANRKAQVSFTASNATSQPLTGRARVAPLGNAKVEWFTIDGPAERPFPAGGTQQYAVLLAVPPTAPAGSYTFQLRLVGVQNPDELYGEGPQIGFEVPPPPKPSGTLPPWIWIVAAVVALLIIAGIAVGIVLATRKPAASVSPATLDFASQRVGVASAPRTVTLKSTGPVDLHVRSLSITGTNAGDFQTTADTCSGRAVSSGGTCTVGITFKPGAAGARNATLQFALDTQGGSQSVLLTGTGALPAVTVVPPGLRFLNSIFGIRSPPQIVRVTNSGNADLHVTSAKTTVVVFAVVQDTCSGHTIAPSQGCLIEVAFTGPAGAAFSGALVIADDAPPGSQSVRLEATP